jgi:hypothetical protein
MTRRTSAARPVSLRTRSGERVKDEVYRQMFLLEERRTGAEVGLALALLRAWLAVESRPASDEERDWLKKISPICLDMIEAAFHVPSSAHPCAE